MMQGEYPILDQLKMDILPHKELWDLKVDFDARMKDWQNGSLKNLIPDDVEFQHGKMRTTAMKLANVFEQKRNQNPMKVAKAMQR